MIKPFLKWAGGKRALASRFERYLPPTYGRYHEPFMGSAALFFHLLPARASLSDTNRRLVRTFLGIKDDVDGVIGRLGELRADKPSFLRVRSQDIDSARDDADVAAWFVYLNRTGFNGLYRVNRAGHFNVPFGRYERPRICDEETLRACSRALRKTVIRSEDFGRAAQRAREGDLVYFDPPYVPLSATSSFTSYTRDGFTLGDHERLRDLSLELHRRGVHVLISNSASPIVRKLYSPKDFHRTSVSARRSINARGDGRGRVQELLLRPRVTRETTAADRRRR